MSLEVRVLRVDEGGDPEPCLGCGQPTLVRVRPNSDVPWLPAHVGHYHVPAAEKEFKVPRFLDELAGQYLPTRKVYGKAVQATRVPEQQPDCLDEVWLPLWHWSRDYAGPVAILDKNAAFIGSAASVEVGHRALVQTGGEVTDGKRPGFYKVKAEEWADEGLPSPLGNAKPGSLVWVTHRRLQLLRRLAGEQRWPEVQVLDSWTSEPVRLNSAKWVDHVKETRLMVLQQFGRGEEYAQLKTRFSQSVQLMGGSPGPRGRTWKGQVHRPDWALTIRDGAICSMWEKADQCRKACPELPPVALRNTDELWVPANALAVLVQAGTIKIDQLGVTLGTFKVKED